MIAAEGVQAGMERANEAPFDLLVSDLGLPDGSGTNLMRHVKERCGVPGIALSGYGTEEDMRASREAGFAVHLVKPVNFEALRHELERLSASLAAAPTSRGT